MAIRYVLRKDLGLAIVQWHGQVTLDEWEAHLHKFLADPKLPDTHRQITDLRFASADDSIGEEGFRRVVGLLEKHMEVVAGRHIAIVATDEFQRAREFEYSLRSLRLTTIVFADLPPACLWLGLPHGLVDSELEALREEGKEGGRKSG